MMTKIKIKECIKIKNRKDLKILKMNGGMWHNQTLIYFNLYFEFLKCK